ncbi:MAG: hypothetical protein ACYDDV_04275 [Methanoregula sp.]
MTVPGAAKGRLVFLALFLLVLVIALAAYQFSGTMGIEERFTHAVGLEGGEDPEEGGGWLGFALEGNPLLYGVVLGVLLLGIIIAFRYSRI